MGNLVSSESKVKNSKTVQTIQSPNDSKNSEVQQLECSLCKEKLMIDKFYKYQRKKETPVCKACLKVERMKSVKKPEPEKDMSQFGGIYIISTIDQMKKDMFKVGKHTGSQRKLISRYRTYLINPVIIMYIPLTDPQQINELEKNALLLLDQHRISDIDGGTTEWIQLPLGELVQKILEIAN